MVRPNNDSTGANNDEITSSRALTFPLEYLSTNVAKYRPVQIRPVACLQRFSFHQFKRPCAWPPFRPQERGRGRSANEAGVGEMIQMRDEEHLHVAVQQCAHDLTGNF